MVWERQRSPHHVPSGSKIGKSKPSKHPLSPNSLYLVEPSSEEPLFHGPLTGTEASHSSSRNTSAPLHGITPVLVPPGSLRTSLSYWCLCTLVTGLRSISFAAYNLNWNSEYLVKGQNWKETVDDSLYFRKLSFIREQDLHIYSQTSFFFF